MDSPPRQPVRPMAIISHHRRFCFIHIPKTAGKSVGNVIGRYAEPVDRHPANRLLSCVGIRVNHIGPYRFRRFRTHATAATIRRNLPRGVYDSLWSFCFVRNPWDMLVSQYEFVLQSRDNKRHRTVRGSSFAQFVRYWLGRRGRGRQTPYVVDDSGRRIVDFIGRYESLEDDFREVTLRLGIAGRLPRLGASSRRDYRSYYDDRLAAFVGDVLADDLQIFGYHFDGFADRPPLRLAA